jgi:pimeloyl-ACP methyl ester carboxylesterase
MVARLVELDEPVGLRRGRDGGVPPRHAAADGGRPGLWREQSAALELWELLASPVYYGIGVPRGDGAPVLVVPGFLGSDDYLMILRGWLRRVGYQPHASGLFCVSPIEQLFARLLRRAETVAAAAQRPLVLIGHSLGGMLCREVARRRPDLVDHVLTLGSGHATARDELDDAAAGDPQVGAWAERLLGAGRPVRERLAAHDLLGGPLPGGVRLSCLYSRDDAVVHWRSCQDTDPRTTLCEVRGSHTGLAWNAQVYRHLGRLLAL